MNPPCSNVVPKGANWTTPRSLASTGRCRIHGRRFSMTLSSRRGVRRGGLIELVVAQHCPQDVEASTGEGQDSLGVAFSFGAFAVVVGPGRGVGAGGDVGGQITGAKQPSVVAAGGGVGVPACC